MRYRVSLLPPEYRQSKITVQKLSRLRRMLLALAAALLTVALLTGLLRMVKRTELAGLQAENSAEAAQIAQLSGYQLLQDELDATRRKIFAVHAADPNWIGGFAELVEALPNGVMLSGMSTNLTTGGEASLTLDCIAAHYGGIAQTIRAMEGCDIVRSVACKESGENDIDVRFVLTVVLAPALQG